MRVPRCSRASRDRHGATTTAPATVKCLNCEYLNRLNTVRERVHSAGASLEPPSAVSGVPVARDCLAVVVQPAMALEGGAIAPSQRPQYN